MLVTLASSDGGNAQGRGNQDRGLEVPGGTFCWRLSARLSRAVLASVGAGHNKLMLALGDAGRRDGMDNHDGVL